MNLISGNLFFNLLRSLSGMSSIVKSPLTPTNEDISSCLKPFITDITVMSIDIPKISAQDDNIVELEKALSFLELKI